MRKYVVVDGDAFISDSMSFVVFDDSSKLRSSMTKWDCRRISGKRRSV